MTQEYGLLTGTMVWSIVLHNRCLLHAIDEELKAIA